MLMVVEQNDAIYACASTDCSTLNQCIGKDFYKYADIFNNCKDDCSCTKMIEAPPF